MKQSILIHFNNIITKTSALTAIASLQLLTNSVTIVDLNQPGHRPLQELVAPNSNIGIFGSVPKYTAFEQHITTLKQRVNFYSRELLKAQELKIKGAKSFDPFKDSNIRKATKKLLQEGTFELIFTRNQHRLAHLFCSTGLKQTDIKGNIHALCTSISRNFGNNGCLIHFLAPSYFDEASLHAEGNLRSPENIHQFLKTVSEMYQQMYEHIEGSSLKIYIVIPPLDKIMSIATLSRALSPQEKFQANFTTLMNIVLEPLKNHQNRFAILNHNAEERNAIDKACLDRGIKLLSTPPPIFNNGLGNNLFIAYKLTSNMVGIRSIQEAIFNQELEEYLQRLKNLADRGDNNA